MAKAARPDECNVCFELMKNFRYLQCGHSFCINCLETLKNWKTITCPVCRKDTEMTLGLQVKHLPRMYVTPQDTSNNLITKLSFWTVEKQPGSLVIDEEAQLIYIAQWENRAEPIIIYTFNRDNLGFMTSDKDLTYTCLTMDTKRGILLATAKKDIVSFSRKGIQTGVISCEEFEYVRDIAYYHYADKYIVSDSAALCIHFVDPKSNTVVRTIPTTSDSAMRNLVHIACAKTTNCSMWATTDWYANTIKIYDSVGLVNRSFKAKGSGHGQFDTPEGVYMNKHGLLIVCDMWNHRLVSLKTDSDNRGEWEVICNTKEHDLGAPRVLDITDDGLAVVAMYNSASKGPYYIVILSGFDGGN